MEAEDDPVMEPAALQMHVRHVQVLELLRAFAADYTYVNRALSQWLGVHSADAAAYAEILYAQDRDAPLTPAQLSRRISLSSGATTALINRLEAAGLVIRSREHQDRRLVALRSDPAIKQEAPRFFGPLGGRLDDLMADYDDQFLDQVATFLQRLHEEMAAFIDQGVAPLR